MPPQLKVCRSFPVPPEGRVGWPWSPDVGSASDTAPTFALPSITVVTPSFNQGKFIEETLRSVLLQQYSKLEYFVVDGGSSDRSVEVIKRYADFLEGWVSERDRGQSNAINKGWRNTKGDIIAWLNSDDIYVPGTLHRVARLFVDHPEVKWICGAFEEFGERGIIQRLPARMNDLSDWLTSFQDGKKFCFPQPSVFLRRSLLQEIGYLDESFHYSFDLEFWCRIRLAGYEPLLTETVLSRFRIHEASKSSAPTGRFREENIAFALSHARRLSFAKRWRVRYRAWMERAQMDLSKNLVETDWPKLPALAAMARRFPMLLLSRMYWGALRRAFRSRKPD